MLCVRSQQVVWEGCQADLSLQGIMMVEEFIMYVGGRFGTCATACDSAATARERLIVIGEEAGS